IEIGDPCSTFPIRLLCRDPREGTVLLRRDPWQVPPRPLLQLLLGGYRTVIVDNLENSSEIAIRRVAELTSDFGKNLVFQKYQVIPVIATTISRDQQCEFSDCPPLSFLSITYSTSTSQISSIYSHDEESAEDQEENGWKYIHGDVFRFPGHKSLFSVVIGSGTQLLAL
ncbi:hypothetical protein Taro_027555, partial [Colocasia esculenta]|nr:hypothetical protein [Colocasia esculenta]